MGKKEQVPAHACTSCQKVIYLYFQHPDVLHRTPLPTHGDGRVDAPLDWAERSQARGYGSIDSGA